MAKPSGISSTGYGSARCRGSMGSRLCSDPEHANAMLHARVRANVFFEVPESRIPCGDSVHSTLDSRNAEYLRQDYLICASQAVSIYLPRKSRRACSVISRPRLLLLLLTSSHGYIASTLSLYKAHRHRCGGLYSSSKAVDRQNRFLNWWTCGSFGASSPPASSVSFNSTRHSFTQSSSWCYAFNLTPQPKWPPTK
jgi:hypothetical protein